MKIFFSQILSKEYQKFINQVKFIKTIKTFSSVSTVNKKLNIFGISKDNSTSIVIYGSNLGSTLNIGR